MNIDLEIMELLEELESAINNKVYYYSIGRKEIKNI